MNTLRSPVGRTRNATSDVQIETSSKHGITHFLQLVIKHQRENVGTLLENPRYFLATNQRDPWIKMVLIIRSVATRFVKVSVKEQFSAFFNAAKTEH
jgi:hypothetical protein